MPAKGSSIITANTGLKGYGGNGGRKGIAFHRAQKPGGCRHHTNCFTCPYPGGCKRYREKVNE